MDWGQLLSNVARPAANAVAARRDRTATEEKQRKQEALAAVAAQRQAKIDADQSAYIGAQTAKLNQPAPPPNIDPNSAAGIAAAIAKSQGEYHPPVQERRDPVKDSIAVKEWERAHPGPQPAQKPQYQILKDDKTGNFSRVRVDGPEGPLNETFTRTGAGQGGPKGAEGGQSQMLRARALAAVSEGRLAHERMTPHEEKKLKEGHGTFNVGLGVDLASKVATGLAGSHNLHGIVGQWMGERGGNALDQEQMQYMRDSRLIARAEQLMSARGGSEAMASDNAFLARGGAGASEATVRAAQKTRKAMFGKMGALVQTLTPEQLEKMNAGLDALKNDDEKFDYAGTGAQLFGGGPRTSGPGTSLPGSAITPEQRQRAAVDPEYKKYLQDTGKLPPGED